MRFATALEPAFPSFCNRHFGPLCKGNAALHSTRKLLATIVKLLDVYEYHNNAGLQLHNSVLHASDFCNALGLFSSHTSIFRLLSWLLRVQQDTARGNCHLDC